MAAKRDTRSRSWFIVINDGSYTGEINYDNMEKLIEDNFQNWNYFCYNEEKGDTGNIHMHVYLELENAVRFSTMQKVFGTAHLAIRRGTPSQARNYVLKPTGMKFGSSDKEKSHTLIRDFVEIGDFYDYEQITKKGSSLTLNEKLDMYTEEYDSIKEVQKVDLWFARQFRNELEEAFEEKAKAKLEQRIGVNITSGGKTELVLRKKIYYLQGGSRTGKTFGIRLKYGRENIYRADCGAKNPFDGYKGQRVLHLDEFRSQFTLADMLCMLDCYDTKLSARYFDHHLMADTIIISSNLSFSEQYTNIQKNHTEYEPFKNRFVNGVWTMLYDPLLNKRYLYCNSQPSDFSGLAKSLVDFSEPPVDCDGVDNIHIADWQTFNAVKELIAMNRMTTDENITAFIKKELEDLPF